MLLSIQVLPSNPCSCRKAWNGRYIDRRTSPMSRLDRVTFRCRNSVTFVGNTKLNWSPRDIARVLFGTGTGVWTAMLIYEADKGTSATHVCLTELSGNPCKVADLFHKLFYPIFLAL
jgi:hypothetical protein